MIIIFLFSKNQNVTKIYKNLLQMLYIPYLFYSSFECVSARHRNFTRSLYLSFENGCSTLEVVSLDLRYARYDAESIGAKVPAWWKSRKSIKGIEKNWEGFTVSGTRFGGHESVPWQRHLVSHNWNPSHFGKRLPSLDPRYSVTKNFHRLARLYLLRGFPTCEPWDHTEDSLPVFVRVFVGLGNFRIKFSTIKIKIFNI